MCVDAHPFLAVGESFWDFTQVSDAEVRELLARPITGPAQPTVVTSPAELVTAAAIDSPGGVPPRDVLDELIGDARVVLIGESSHGTHEFYAARAEITKWLITEKLVSTPLPPKRIGPTPTGSTVTFAGLGRTVRRRRRYAASNGSRRGCGGTRWYAISSTGCAGTTVAALPTVGVTGFYGLDLYSLHRSMQEVIGYLDTVDPKAAGARARYACFDHSDGDDGQAYGYAAAFGAGPRCERQAVEQLVDMNRNATEYLSTDGLLAEDELFYAQQNAMTVRNAEAYYRGMFSGRVTSWNMRDKHMAQTLHALQAHLDRHDGPEPARIVVWAHNSHVGDARATEVSADGQLTIGQLAREHYGQDCRLIGFSTHPARSPRQPTGVGLPNTRWYGRHSPAASRNCYTRPANRPSSSPCTTARRPPRHSRWSDWAAPSG